MHTSMSEKSDDTVVKQEKSLSFKKKIITEMKADGQIQLFWPIPVLGYCFVLG